MKRITFIVLALILVVTGLAGCSSTSNCEVDLSKKILYVAGRLNDNDKVIINHLKEIGYEVSLTNGDLIQTEDAPLYGAIIVGGTSNVGQVGGKLKQSTTPILHLHGEMTFTQGLTGKKEDIGTLSDQTKIKIKDESHPIAAGLKGEVTVYKANAKMGHVKPGPEATIIATAVDDESKATIFAYEKNTKGAPPFELPVTSRQVFFFLKTGEESSQTAESWKLFDASLKWLTEQQ